MSDAAGLLSLDAGLLARIIQPGRIVAGIMTCRMLRDQLPKNVTEIHIKAGHRSVELEDLDVFFSRFADRSFANRMQVGLTVCGKGEKLSQFLRLLAKATGCLLVSSLRLNSNLNYEQAVILSGQLCCFRLAKVNMLQTRLDEGAWICLLSGLRSCKGLEDVELGQCDLGRTEAAIEIPQTLLHLSNIKSLDLHSNQLRAPDLGAIINALTHCEALTSLNLGWNKLDMTTSGQMASALPACKALQSLNIMQTDLDPDKLTAILSGMQRSRALRELLVQMNSRFGNNGARSLGLSLKLGWDHLTKLDVSRCSIGDQGMTGLADGLERCTALKNLNLVANSFREAGATAVAEALRACPALECLGCSQNTVGDAGVRALLSGLEESQSLKMFDLIHADGYTVQGARAVTEWKRSACLGGMFVGEWARMYEALRSERADDAAYTWEVVAWRLRLRWRLAWIDDHWDEFDPE